LFTAQYGSGSTAAFALGDDGRVLKRSSLIRHTGSGPNKSRQGEPHPHSTVVDPTNRFVMVPDLGTDKIVVYKFDPATAELKTHGHGEVPAGGGPRHMKFHPGGRFAYVVNELDLSVTAFDYDAKQGTLVPIQTISTLPEDEREVPSSCSEIRVHPSGKFLYAANRGHDSIAAFTIDPQTGKLTFVEREPIRGCHPRNFNVDPSGKWLLAAGRDSNTISVFKIDEQTGGLVYTGVVNSPAPICIEFQPQS
jgi:6-phosphogluconolactonase